MRKHKKLWVSVCVIILFSVTTVYGAVKIEEKFEPMAKNYMSASAAISLSGSSVKVSGRITGKIGKTTETSVQLYLQQYKNGRWITIADWVYSGETVSASISKTRTVAKGYKYRAKAICTAYGSNDKETVTKYSRTIIYR